MTTVNEFKRYGIQFGAQKEDLVALRQQIASVGGRKITEAKETNQLMVSLTDVMATRLTGLGYAPVLVQSTASSGVSTPTPIISAAVYQPVDLMNLLGLNQFRLSLDPPMSGNGFVVAVIGTGIRATHGFLGGKVIYSKNFTSDSPGDGFDHDTGVASIIHAVVPDAAILDLKVIDRTGNGTEEAVVLALNHCIELLDTNPSIAPNVINMSLGSNDDDNPNNVVRVACRAALDKGFVIIASAGNNGAKAGAITVPACEQDVAAIGSMSVSPLAVDDFSSRGPTRRGLVKPDAVFLGDSIIMASSANDLATVSKSGTSFSTPMTSGVVILTMEGIKRTQNIPLSQVVGKNVLTGRIVVEQMFPQVCTKPQSVVDRLKDNDYGYGIPVGSLMVQTTGVGNIDWSGTLNMSVTLMMLTVMTGMMRTL